jgi:hypothetical protein
VPPESAAPTLTPSWRRISRTERETVQVKYKSSHWSKRQSTLVLCRENNVAKATGISKRTPVGALLSWTSNRSVPITPPPPAPFKPYLVSAVPRHNKELPVKPRTTPHTTVQNRNNGRSPRQRQDSPVKDLPQHVDSNTTPGPLTTHKSHSLGMEIKTPVGKPPLPQNTLISQAAHNNSTDTHRNYHSQSGIDEKSAALASRKSRLV